MNKSDRKLGSRSHGTRWKAGAMNSSHTSRKRTPQTSLRKAIAYIRRTRYVSYNEARAILILKHAIKRCDDVDFRKRVAQLRRTP